MFLDNFNIEKQNNGIFIYKSKELVLQQKKSIKKTIAYKDKAEYSLIEQIENNLISDFEDSLKNIISFFKK